MEKRLPYLLFICFFVTIIPDSLYAKPIDAARAKQIAREHLKGTSTRSSSADIKLIFFPPATRSVNNPEYYVFETNTDGGFLIVSGDDEVNPIAGYSTASTFKPDSIPPALMYWLDEYSKYIGDIRSGITTPAMNIATTSALETVQPLLTTEWDQGEPYNDLCPTYGNGKAAVGCVATAMAQIMKYHNWPQKGKGQATNSRNTIDFSQSVYDWKNMIDTYSYYWNSSNEYVASFTTIQASAVAKLMVDCGYSVNMAYGAESGAQSTAVIAALVDNFSYSPQTKTLTRECYNTSDWTGIIRAELKANRPLYYAGGSSSSAHAFVCDGIDGNNYLHINWGWGGYSDGYFDMNYMNPSGTGTGGGAGNYFMDQSIIIGIQPIKPEEEGTVQTPSLTLSYDIKLHKTNPLEQITVPREKASATLFVEKLANTSGRTYSGALYIGLLKDDKLTNLLSKINISTLLVGYYYYDLKLDFKLPDNLEPGSYQVLLMHQPTGKEEYYYVEAGSRKDHVIAEVNASEVTFKVAEYSKPAIKINSVKVQTAFYTGSNASLICNLKNEGRGHLINSFKFAFVHEDTDTPDIDLSSYWSNSCTWAIYGESELNLTASIKVTQDPGKYRVYIGYNQYDENGVLKTFILPEVTAQYITVKEPTDYPVIIMNNKFTLNNDSYEQGANKAIAANVIISANKTGTVAMGIFARKKDDINGKEIELLSKEIDVTTNEHWIEGLYGYTNAMYALEPGEYTAYLKYGTEGDMAAVEPEDFNCFNFVVKTSDAPSIKITETITFDNEYFYTGSNGKLKTTLQATAGYSGRIFFYGRNENTFSQTISGYSVAVELEANVPKEIELRYSCFEDAEPGTSSIGIIYSYEDKQHDVFTGYFGVPVTIIKPVYSSRPVINSPIVINNNKDIERGSSGIISIDLKCESDYNGQMYIYSIKDGNLVLEGNYIGVELKAGVSQKVELPFECKDDAPLGECDLGIGYLWNGVFYLLDQGDNQGIFNVAFPTGIPENASIDILAYPDGNGIIIEGTREKGRVSIMDITGKLLYNGDTGNGITRVELPGKTYTGIYLIIVEQENVSRTLKVKW